MWTAFYELYASFFFWLNFYNYGSEANFWCGNVTAKMLLMSFFHVSLIIKQVVLVILENYACPLKKSKDHNVNKPDEKGWTQEMLELEDHASSSSEVSMRVLSWKAIFNEKGEVNVSM